MEFRPLPCQFGARAAQIKESASMNSASEIIAPIKVDWGTSSFLFSPKNVIEVACKNPG